MKQIFFETFGPPALVARCVSAPPVGPPSAWEVIVKVAACPINPADLAMLHGNYGWLNKPPATIGMEGAGTIVEIGRSVTDLAVGDRVVIMANNNWAQYRKVPATLVVKVPAEIDWKQAAMLKVNPLTALRLLKDFGGLKPGDWVIQNTPFSNVGIYLQQIAELLQLHTINVVRDSEQLARGRTAPSRRFLIDSENLAEECKSLTGGQPIRVGIDGIAGEATQRLATCLAEQGVVVNFGMLSNQPCQLSPEQTIFRGIQLQGFWLTRILNRLPAQERHQHIQQLADWSVQQKLVGPVDSIYPLEQIGEAIRRAEQRGRTGKVLLMPHGEAG